jgi:hypothetical protein
VALLGFCRDKRCERNDELLDAREPVLACLGQCAQHDVIELAGERRVPLRRRDGWLLHDLHDKVGMSVCVKRSQTRQCFIEDDAKSIDVRARIDVALASQLLR